MLDLRPGWAGWGWRYACNLFAPLGPSLLAQPGHMLQAVILLTRRLPLLYHPRDGHQHRTTCARRRCLVCRGLLSEFQTTS